MASETHPQWLMARGALLLAGAAGAAGARWQADGTVVTLSFIACAWAAVLALAMMRHSVRLAARGASRLEAPASMPRETEAMAARLLALDLQLEHAPIALFRIDLSAAPPLVEPVNANARRLLAPGRATDGGQVRRALAGLVNGQRTVIDFDTEQGSERALATVSAIVVEGRPLRIAALMPMENELEAEAIQAWQRLVHVLTHEIMNSLTPVASLSRTLRGLLGRASLPPALANDADTSLDAISRRADSLTHVVNGYRALASVPPARAQRVVVADMFARLSALAAPAWEARGGRALFSVDPGSLELLADPGQLEQALMNLLKNAEEATAAQPAPEVSVSARLARGGRLRIEVADNGPGVPDDLVADIFTPFFSTKSKGSGIGLAMVRQLAHRNGGAVRYAKAVGAGARFVLTF